MGVSNAPPALPAPKHTAPDLPRPRRGIFRGGARGETGRRWGAGAHVSRPGRGGRGAAWAHSANGAVALSVRGPRRCALVPTGGGLGGRPPTAARCTAALPGHPKEGVLTDVYFAV